jgi:hypothetical protein
MFGNRERDLADTIKIMQDTAYDRANCDQIAAIRLTAEYMSQDRRLDKFPDKLALAKEAADCRAHGRKLDLSGNVYYKPNPMAPSA